MIIKILGAGCPKCENVEKNLNIAIEELNIDAQIEKVEELVEIVKYGVMTTPTLIIDGEIKFMGKVPSVKEIKGVLTKQ
ncbi:thioredoxin family protein [Tissierella praeacuta]|uniref:thioredoxin family protein n=1 Tax=Tissierella praeacuta TaxID=43131 RepID=UPI00104513E2|nr:thioredoxin family protein [Tissierella praeacuta]TCU79428.1 small redox-active disulfide protein 2 [Tissierella praeacuta]